MFRKRNGDAADGNFIWAKVAGVGFCLVAVVGITAMILRPHQGPSEPTKPNPLETGIETISGVQPETPSLLGDEPIVDQLTLLPGERAAPPPIIFEVGAPTRDNPDLSSPATAVYSVLDLIDKGDLNQLPQCFTNGTGDLSEAFYPHYLGHPIELVDVIEEDGVAKIHWNATAHTAFSGNDTNISPSDVISLTTRLEQIDGQWKLIKLHE